MNLYTTRIDCLIKGEVTVFAGPQIPAISFADAEDYCQRNGLGYCVVDGIFTGEIPLKQNGDPDWNNQINTHYKLN
jgi:hypothetical protein